VLRPEIEDSVKMTAAHTTTGSQTESARDDGIDP
jgi:hypothetical protein